MDIRVEFAGGTELLFDKAKTLDVKLENDGQDWTISRLIRRLSEKYIKERVELFSVGDKIRPGILVLINDVDFEILGGYEYKLKPNDKVLFISTLHGG
jgi:ubiquitin related modifier 1